MGASSGKLAGSHQDRVQPISRDESFGPERLPLAGNETARGGDEKKVHVLTCPAASSSTNAPFGSPALSDPSGSSWSGTAFQNLPSQPSTTMSRETMEVRLHALEELAGRQAAVIKEMQQALNTVQRDCRRTVSVMQYNILASYLGKNTQPWFLYGADITPDQRERIFQLYYERDASGKPKNAWPKYVEGVLTPEQVAEVDRHDLDFRWENRKVKLVEEIRTFDSDVISLVELDHFDYFEQCLRDQWDGVFHKRPRAASIDGCGVFWRRSKFTMVAQQGFDFIDGSDDKGREKRDRSCLMVILRWRHQESQSPLVIVSTHLAKDPDNRGQTAIRVRQVTQIMEGLMEFTNLWQAADAPVILMGDLNARHFGEIRGIARTVWQVTGSELHKFLWSATDVPTGPTSITKARQCRIDVVQFLSSQLEVLDVVPVPSLPKGQVIPNAKHPSDHLPVCCRFRVKDTYQQHMEIARAWLECVAGKEKLHPLTQDELRMAFEFFDRDRSKTIHRHDLEEACLELNCNFHVDVQRLLLACFPNEEIDFSNFIRAYEVRLNHERIRCIGELEFAFQYFAKDAETIQLAKLADAFREITPINFSDEEVKEMIGKLNLEDGQEYVDLHRFCEVVCKANFPHRDRRKHTLDVQLTASTPRSSSTPRGTLESARNAALCRRDCRYNTKEIGRRLDELNRIVTERGSIGALSSHHSLGSIGSRSNNGSFKAASTQSLDDGVDADALIEEITLGDSKPNLQRERLGRRSPTIH